MCKNEYCMVKILWLQRLRSLWFSYIIGGTRSSIFDRKRFQNGTTRQEQEQTVCSAGNTVVFCESNVQAHPGFARVVWLKRNPQEITLAGGKNHAFRLRSSFQRNPLLHHFKLFSGISGLRCDTGEERLVRKEAWISQIQEWGIEWGTPKMGNFIGKMMINPEAIVF